MRRKLLSALSSCSLRNGCHLLIALLVSGCQLGGNGEILTLRTAVKIWQGADGVELQRIVNLPDVWEDDVDSVGSVTYRLSFVSSASQRPQALLVPQFGNFVRARLNGLEIAQFDRPRSVLRDASFFPTILHLPGTLLREQNLLELQVTGRANAGAGLSQVLAGPSNQIEKLFGIYWSLSVGLLIVMLTTGGFVLLFAVLLWLGTRNVLYLALSASAVSLVAYALMLQAWHETPIDWDKASALLVSYHTFIALVGFCALSMFGMARRRLLELTIIYWVGLAASVAVSAILESITPYLVTRLLGLIFVMAAVTYVVRAGMKRSSLTAWALILTAAVGIGLVLRDVLGSLTGQPSFGELPLYRLLAPGFMVTVTMFVIEQYTETYRTLHQLNASLERRIADAEAELRQAFDSLRAAERATAIEQERRRLMRDIHDGMGSQLISTLSLAEEPDATRSEIVEAIENCITELRVAVDSLEPFENDLLAALGTLRIRVEPMLSRANVRLRWRMRELSDQREWSASDMGHLLRVLLEAFANVVRHSGASCATMCCATSHRYRVLWISVCDNGTGLSLPGARRLGRGLNNIGERAERMGAQLLIRSRPRGTVVRLVWPLVLKEKPAVWLQ